MNILEARRRTLGKGVYKKTVEGNPAIAQGSLARMYPGITMQGWTEQESTTGANLIDYTQAIPRNTSQSVEIIDGGVKWTGDYYFIISVTGLEKNQTYTMHYVSDDASGWMFGYTDGTYSSQRLNGGAGTTDPEKDCDKVFIYKSNPTVSGQDMVFTDIMLNAGSTALPYEPYTGGQPSPSPDYPQEIVSAGNYDEGSGKYQYTIKISDSEESPTKSQTVLLTSDHPLTKWDKLGKRNGQWGWVYKSKRFTSNDMISFIDTWMPSMVWSIKNKEDYVVQSKDFYCEYFKDVRTSNAVGSGFAINVNDYPEIQTAEDMANFVNSKEGSELPVTVCAETIRETFVPLSESEQEQMNALHTFRPTTVLSNQQDCDMTLTYKTRKGMS